MTNFHDKWVRPDDLDTLPRADKQEVMAVMYFIDALKRRGLIKEYSKINDHMTCMYSFKHMAEDFYNELKSRGIKCFEGVGHIHQDSAVAACQKMFFDPIRRPNDGNFTADGWYNYVALFRIYPKGKHGVSPSRIGKIIAKEVYEEARYISPLLKGIAPGGLHFSRANQRFFETA